MTGTSMIVDHPAAGRNAEPLYSVVRTVLQSITSAAPRALELASGAGQHVELFASRHPEVQWQPSEPREAMRASIDARVAQAGLGNVLPALNLDVRTDWPAAWRNEPFDLFMTVNLLHISPWAVTAALIANAVEFAAADAALLIYGPFKRQGVHTSRGNTDFDAELRERDSSWGIRDLEAVVEVARASDWREQDIVAMPANNFCLLFRR